MRLKCRQCGIELTPELVLLDNAARISEQRGADFLPRGTYLIGNGRYYSREVGTIVNNEHDLINARNHPDHRRAAGCCGLGGVDGKNKVCLNGHEVAVGIADRWIAHAVLVDPRDVAAERASNRRGWKRKG